MLSMILQKRNNSCNRYIHANICWKTKLSTYVLANRKRYVEVIGFNLLENILAMFMKSYCACEHNALSGVIEVLVNAMHSGR